MTSIVTIAQICGNPNKVFMDLKASLDGRGFISDETLLRRGTAEAETSNDERSVAQSIDSCTEECSYSISGRVRYCGELMYASTRMAGRAYARGSAWELDGDIHVRTFMDMLLFRLTDGTMQQEDVYRAIQELFFLVATGVDQGVPPSRRASHAAMYLEAHWPTPPLCAMLFHQQPRDFLNDLLRTYVGLMQDRRQRDGV